ELDKIESTVKPDCVFSIFGPTYWNPRTKHIVGFAQGYYLYGELPYFNSLGFYKKLKLLLLKNYHTFLLRHHSNEFVVETSDVQTRLSKLLDIDKEKIHVVTNTSSSYFKNFKSTTSISSEINPFRLLTIASPYPHKNLLILKDVVDILKNEARSYEFTITVPDEFFFKEFSGYEKFIKNVGVISNSECPKLYDKCDAMILPTLVECFSASYPEAMIMKKPILTSNYSFSQSICGDAAIYFDPLNANDIAEKILSLSSDRELYGDKVKLGIERLNHFDTPYSRCKKYIDLCNDIVRI
ncbi:glycosyltransferase, partial [Vibrio sp. ER1A]|uniref:glycosyltransferase n=1 Tax=Vibrio sp. ER1A TaxID=1517681 RepID=UPI0004DD3C74